MEIVTVEVNFPIKARISPSNTKVINSFLLHDKIGHFQPVKLIRKHFIENSNVISYTGVLGLTKSRVISI